MDTFVFKRYEYKYFITKEMFDTIMPLLLERLEKDNYYFTTIQSLYFDSDNYRLIRRSIEKPVYKEKLRLRCYGLNTDDKPVFFEIKKKYKGVVYKRRIKVNESIAYEMAKNIDFCNDSQISKEIGYFLKFYGNLSPKMLIIYDRFSLCDKKTNLRITFDHNIRYRDKDLNLSTSLDGKKLREDEYFIMEIKSNLTMPFWLARLLSDHKIYKSSFSKYKEAYIQKWEEINGKNIRIDYKK